MLDTYEHNSKRKLFVTILSVVVIAGAITFADYIKNKGSTLGSQQQSNTSPTPSTSTDTINSSVPSTSSASTTEYKDGTYSATSEYYVPHGNESIQVSLTLKAGVITNSLIKNSEGDHESAAYQEDFEAAYKSYVVGKKLTDLKLGIVAGASDTTEGFNEAVSRIITTAHA